LGGLSPLAVWLVKLGIAPQRTRPAHPQDNGAHERMHKTLKQATAKPPRADAVEQQKAFERFRDEFNEERPHEALGMKTPSEVYVPSSRPFPARLPEIAYPSGALTKRVNVDGTIWFKEKRIYVSKALADEYVRMDEEGRGEWAVYFGPVALGQLDLAREMIKTKPAKVLPMRPV
jgi:putative transposase